MRTTTLRCFGATPAGGNPALVVEAGPPDPAARQALARKHGMTVVFIDGSAAQPVLDYWYPHTRSPLCLHATLAAAHVLFAQPHPPAAPPPPPTTSAAPLPSPATSSPPLPSPATSAPSPSSPPASATPLPSSPRTRGPHFPTPPLTLTVTTAMHGQSLILSRDADNHYVQLSAQPAPTLAALPDIASLLGHPGLCLASPPQVASVGSPKLLVEVADTATLYALQPDLPAVSAWGKASAVNGLYAWCRRPDGELEGRNFNHLDPALEDIATGVAAGALTTLFGRAITLHQGAASGHPCLLRTRATPGAVLVGGLVSLQF